MILLDQSAASPANPWLLREDFLAPNWHWVAAGLTLLAGVALARALCPFVIARLGAWARSTPGRTDDRAVSRVGFALRVVVYTLGAWIAWTLFPARDVRGDEPGAVDAVLGCALALSSALFFSRVSFLVVAARVHGRGWAPAYEEGAARILGQGVSAVLWLAAGGVSLRLLGFSMGALLAPLGVGTVAGALLARETLPDFIGGLMLFFGRSFKIGDRSRIHGSPAVEGVVGDVSLRRTTLRTDDGSVITVPNARLCNAITENLSAPVDMPVRMDLPISSLATAEQIRGALGKLRAVVSREPAVDDGSVEVRFAGFTSAGFRLVIAFRLRSAERLVRDATRERVNFVILETLDRLGLTMPGEPPPFPDPEIPPPPSMG